MVSNCGRFELSKKCIANKECYNIYGTQLLIECHIVVYKSVCKW